MIWSEEQKGAEFFPYFNTFFCTSCAGESYVEQVMSICEIGTHNRSSHCRQTGELLLPSALGSQMLAGNWDRAISLIDFVGNEFSVSCKLWKDWPPSFHSIVHVLVFLMQWGVQLWAMQFFFRCHQASRAWQLQSVSVTFFLYVIPRMSSSVLVSF